MHKETPTAKPAAGSKRKTLLILLVVAIMAIGLAALYLYWMDPPRPWIVRWQIERYLKKHTGNSNFKVDFPFPSKAEMAKRSPVSSEKAPTKGSKTGKDFDTLKSEYIKIKSSIFNAENSLADREKELVDRKALIENLSKQLTEAVAANGTNVIQLQENLTNQVRRIARVESEIPGLKEALKQVPAKEEQLVPIVSDLWEFQRFWAAEQARLDAQPENVLAKARVQMNTEMRKKLDEAKTWAAIYRVIGDQLYVAGRLLESANDIHRQMGLGMVLQAIQYARDDAENYWLAARIAEAFIWPNLDVGQENRRSQLSPENLLNAAANAFRENAEYENVVRNYELLLSHSPQRADWAHSQIAFAHEQAGEYKLAIENLRAIKATNDFRWQLRNIPRLEERLNYSQKK